MFIGNSPTCSCGRVKETDNNNTPSTNNNNTDNTNNSLDDNHLQMYILDCTSLFMNSRCKWVPTRYLTPSPASRKLFTASLGLNEILLFGGLANLYRNESPCSDDCTIAVRAKPSWWLFLDCYYLLGYGSVWLLKPWLSRIRGSFEIICFVKSK